MEELARDGVLAIEVVPEQGGPDLAPVLAERVPGGFEDYGDGPFEERPRGLVRGLLRRIGDDEVVGTMSWHLVSHGPTVGSRAWNIGIWLRPAFRGLGYGASAQRLLARALLTTTEVLRVEAGTEVTNLAERRALERAGFRLDGVLRGAHERLGEQRDAAVYSLLRSDLDDLDDSQGHDEREEAAT